MGVLFFGFMRPKGGNISLFKECIINSLILAVAPLIMLLFYYVPTYTDMGTNTLFNYLGSPGGGAGGIAMIYFIPVPIFSVITACVLTYFNRKSGSVWLGALLMTLFFTWLQIAVCFWTNPVV